MIQSSTTTTSEQRLGISNSERCFEFNSRDSFTDHALSDPTSRFEVVADEFRHILSDHCTATTLNSKTCANPLTNFRKSYAEVGPSGISYVIAGNDRGLLSAVAKHLAKFASQFLPSKSRSTQTMSVAFEEALLNAAIHGNLDVSSDLRADVGDAFQKLIDERIQTSPYRDRVIRIDAVVTNSEIRVSIKDEGAGFSYDSLPDPCDISNLVKPSGRGILLMKTFVDEVQFNETGNQVTLILNR